MTQLEDDQARVEERIATACRQAGRAREEVRLLAVSKTRSDAEIQALHRLGQRLFGENYVQEFIAKHDALTGLEPPLEWHFIGALQTNKTRAVAERAAWVHGIDRLKIAERLSRQRPAGMAPLQVCLQIDLSGEPGKAGVPPREAGGLAAAVAPLPNLVLRGLMAIPAPAEDPTAQRRPFARLRELRDALNTRGLELDTLSMGMSDDLEAAILEGSTLVRVGTALFGPRRPKARQ
ncbi:YggS family pyridoxal phosphate-dependent enzyme [Thioalkalivibrio sp.]|uniref:YggS family pyridoxal phosphate-dependent enzyme n=1 Tax=Thioalkalivibrio sp. TaxID=2093813 RepID=UPI003976C8F8